MNIQTLESTLVQNSNVEKAHTEPQINDNASSKQIAPKKADATPNSVDSSRKCTHYTSESRSFSWTAPVL